MARFDFAQVVRWLRCDIPVSGTVSGFKQNSHDLEIGDLFFALKGEKADGHTFLEQVAKKGAIGAVVSKEYRGDSFGMTLIPVDDVLASLQKLAQTVHASRNMRVVGVTGSVGKTTTKEFIATLLEGKFRVGKTPGNANSQVGVPLSLLNAEGDEEVFVLEMGMSEPHQIERLVAIAPPEVALITKVSLSHAQFFLDGLEGIAKAKAEIFSHPLTRLGVMSAQVASFAAAQTGSCEKKVYSFEDEGKDGDFTLCRDGLNFYALERRWRSPTFTLPFSASHLLENFMGAASVARAMGMQWTEIIPQAQKLSVFKRRFERVEKNGIVFINDSYNASLVSMKAALTNLPHPTQGGKKIAVLGAMKELGAFSEQNHIEVAHIALSNVDHLLCFGEECLSMVDVFQKGNKPVEYFLEMDAMKLRVFTLAEEGDVVLLKGANSNKLWQILESV